MTKIECGNCDASTPDKSPKPQEIIDPLVGLGVTTGIVFASLKLIETATEEVASGVAGLLIPVGAAVAASGA